MLPCWVGLAIIANGSDTTPAALTAVYAPSAVGFDCPAIPKFAWLPSALLRLIVPDRVLTALGSEEFTWMSFGKVFEADAGTLTERVPEPLIVLSKFGFNTRTGTGDNTLLIPQTERAGTPMLEPAPTRRMNVVGTWSVMETWRYGEATRPLSIVLQTELL